MYKFKLRVRISKPYPRWALAADAIREVCLWVVGCAKKYKVEPYNFGCDRRFCIKFGYVIYPLRPINLVHNKFGYKNFGYHNFSHKLRKFLVYNNFRHIFSTFRDHFPFHLFDFSIIKLIFLDFAHKFIR